LSFPVPELRFCRSSIEQNRHLTTILPAATVRHRRLGLRRPAHAVGDERADGSLAAIGDLRDRRRVPSVRGIGGRNAKVPDDENGNPLEHDPEKWIRFSEKFMLQQKATEWGFEIQRWS
jgi:hypothetical protein